MGKNKRSRSPPAKTPASKQAPDTHYVLIVHGTWNSYDKHSSLLQEKWYWATDVSARVFVNHLRERLRGTPLENAVWRHVQGLEWPFSWNGQNSHEARLVAARELAQQIIHIVTVDPTARLHFVAHSHGGNVLLKALEIS